jgi:hypothetical protein
MTLSRSQIVAFAFLAASLSACAYAACVGTRSPAETFLVLGAIPVFGLVSSAIAVRLRSPYVAIAGAFVAFFGIPAAIGIAYLRSGV